MFTFGNPVGKSWAIVISILAMIVMMVLTQPSFSQEESPELYLQKYCDLLDSFSTISFSSICSSYTEPDIADVHTYKFERAVDFKKEQYYSKYIDSVHPDQFDLRFYNANQVIGISIDPNQENDDDKYRIRSWCTHPLWNEFVTFGYTSLAFGYWGKGSAMIYIPEILRDSRSQEVTMKNGIPSLNTVTDQFEINIVFNKEKDYCPEKIQIRRLTPPVSPHDATLLEYSVKEYQKVNEKWFPYLFNLTESYPGGHFEYHLPPGISFATTGEDLLPRKAVVEVELSDLKVYSQLPDEYFKIPITIPNGTRVSMQDALQIEHIWMDGKIVPKTDEAMLKIAQSGHKFLPGPKEPRFWLILFGIIAVLASGGWKLYTFWTLEDESFSPSTKAKKG